MIRSFYNRLVRPRLPHKRVIYNGVVTYQGRITDITAGDRRYQKESFYDACRRYIESGDEVVVLGGDLGVGTVVAARHCYPGSVTTFEANRSNVFRIVRTAEDNHVADRVRVEHAVVGTLGELGPDAVVDGAKTVHPDSLPPHDVAVVDIDGAELDFLGQYAAEATTLVVEAHEFLKCPLEKVAAAMVDAGYEVVERIDPHPEEPGARSGYGILVGSRLN